MSDQAERLRQQIDVNKNTPKGKTIAIVSGKGGVGKSNFAINFCIELVNSGKKPLLIDLDIGMGNVDVLLGRSANKTIVDLLKNMMSASDIVQTNEYGLDYIAGGSAINELFTLSEREKNHFYKQYNELTRMYDYIIFDMGAGVTEESLFFILASDEIIVVTTPEPTSITDSYSMMKHIINKHRHIPIYIVMNRSFSQKSSEFSLERIQRASEQFLNKSIISLGMIPDDKAVPEAVMKQNPYTILRPKSRATRAVKQLTTNYLTDSQPNENIKHRSEEHTSELQSRL